MVSTLGMSGMSDIPVAFTNCSKISSYLVRMLSLGGGGGGIFGGYCWWGQQNNHDRLILNMEIAQHGIGVPAFDEANYVTVHA